MSTVITIDRYNLRGTAEIIAAKLYYDFVNGKIRTVDGDAIHFAVTAADVANGCTLDAQELDLLEDYTARAFVRRCV